MSEVNLTPTEFEKTDAYAKEATKVEVIGIITNFLLFVFKLAAGILGHSGAMISDAIHTASDVFADLIAIIGLQVSKKTEDDNHPYGHEKIECVFTTVLGIILIIVAIEVGKSAVTGIYGFITGNPAAVPVPGVIAIVAAVVSIVSKEILFRYVIGKSKKLHSPTLKATAWHHRSDSMSSIGALIGIVGAKLGFPVLDAIASLIICLIVLKIGIEVLVTSIQNLVDTYAGEEVQEQVLGICNSVKGVESVVVLKTRQFGPKIYVEVTIGCDKTLTIEEGHNIADEVHDKLEDQLRNIKHVFVHVDPVDCTKRSK